MKSMLFDTVDASGARLTKDGFLVAEANVARTGIQLYTAKELEMDGDETEVIRVYRPPDEVFAADAMASYAHRPVTVEHPAVLIDATNWKDHAKGQTGDEVLRDGEFVRVPLMLMDKDAIEDWANGKKQLSMGYTMDLKITDGQTPDGEKYDAIQTNLRMNHLALVSRARGGSELRLGDRKPKEDSNMSDVKLTTILVDGLSVETTEPGAQAISKLLKDLAAAHKETATSAEAHTKAIAGKDTELAGKDAEIDALNGKQLSDADIDKRVNDRADLIATAKQIADKDYTGKSDNDIRKMAVSAVLGQDTIEGKSDDYVLARFEILSEDESQDGVRRVLKSGGTSPANAVDKAHSDMVNDVSNAWKGEAA
jgi:hypothetical protein